MSLQKQLKRYVGKRTARRISNALPWVGAAAAFAVGSAVGEKTIRAAINDVRARTPFQPRDHEPDDQTFEKAPV